MTDDRPASIYELVMEALADLGDQEAMDGIPREEVVGWILERTEYQSADARDAIEHQHRNGEIYEPAEGQLRRTDPDQDDDDDDEPIGVECCIDGCEGRIVGLEDGRSAHNREGVACSECWESFDRHAHWPDEEPAACVECMIDNGAVRHQCDEMGDGIDAVILRPESECEYCGESVQKVATDGSGHVCDACGETFGTLTRLRLHEQDDCPQQETFDTFDPNEPDVGLQASKGLLTCRSCDRENPNADFEQTADFADGNYHLIVEFECRHCGFENKNRIVGTGVDEDDLGDLPPHLQPDTTGGEKR